MSVQMGLLAIVASAVAFSACGSSENGPAGNTCRPAPGPAGGGEPQRLSETGLYADTAAKRLGCDVVPYAPTHQLWSDGADKQRWILLPAGARIDTSDMDHWRFPIGTKFFKEFARDGRRLETRLIEHVADTGKIEDDYRASAFVWRDDESDAELALEGAKDVRGTDHDVPKRDDCFKCHIGEPGKVLGFSAIQLSRVPRDAADVTLKWLADQGKLTAAAAPEADFSAPGDAATANALGYLHANCGHCHNKNGLAWRDTNIVLRLSVAERDPRSAAIHTSSVGIAMQRPQNSPYVNRIVAGRPAESALLYRMGKRDGTPEAMPPLASEKQDAQGTSILTTWIQGL